MTAAANAALIERRLGAGCGKLNDSVRRRSEWERDQSGNWR